MTTEKFIEAVRPAGRILSFVLIGIFLAGCTHDRLTLKPTRNLEQGLTKTLDAEFSKGNCSHTLNVYAQYRKNAASPTPWINSNPATLSGNIYSSDIPNSALFLGGDTYDFKWVHNYDDWDMSGMLPACRKSAQSEYAGSFSVVAPTTPTLALSPNPINVNAGATGTGTLTLSAASSANLSVTLTPQGSGAFQINNAPAGQAASVTVGANQTTATFTVAGVNASSGTVQAAAPGYTSGSSTVNVKPVITGLSPASGAPGSSVTVTGRGYVPGASVRFGQTAAATNFASSTQLTAAVPANVSGAQQVTVLAANQTSNAIGFTVTAAPPPTPSPVVFRSSDSHVQSFNFTTSGSPSPINSLGTTLSPGMLVVGLGFNGANVLVRSSASDIQTFSVNAAGQLALGSSAPATLSPVGAAILVRSNQVIRASASDIQVFSLSGTNLALQGSLGAALSSTGTGVDFTVINSRSLAVRGYSGGLEVFDITQPSTPSLRGNNNTTVGLSSMGVGVRVIGNRAIRAYSGGIEVFDLTPNNPSRITFNTTGALSGTGVGVDSDSSLSRIVRATNMGIEIFQLSGTTLTKLGAKNGALSPTGVAVAMVGNRVFRAESGGIEEYDISNPANIVLVGRITSTLSSTGVGIALR